MINILWTIFYQNTFVQTGDWLRSCPDGINTLPLRALEISKILFPIRDPNIRGWLSEAALTLALQSSYRESILKIDNENTYSLPIKGEHNSYKIGEGWVVTVTPGEISPMYIKTFKVTLNISTGDYIVTGPSNIETTGQSIIEGRTFTGVSLGKHGKATITIPYGTTGTAIDFVIEGRSLPPVPAYVYIEEGLNKVEQSFSLGLKDAPLQERVGQLSLYLLQEVPWEK